MNVVADTPTDAIDQITLQVVNNHLVTTAREMGIAMRNTSYSPLFNEGLDFSCAIFDAEGEMIAQAEFCPAHLGAIIYVVEWTILEIGKSNFHPGDVVLHNDPFRGGCHLPEYCVIKPVFAEGQISAYVACIGHMTEVGGKVPGGFAGDATEVFQEGLRIPPLKIVDQGRDVDAVWDIIMANVRTPRMSYGDLKAMIGSLYVGERRVSELVQKHGLRKFIRLGDAIKDYSERRMRAELVDMPDGVYRFEDDVIDNDGITQDPARLKLAVTIEGDHVTMDYTGSDPQRRGPVNCTYGVTASATYNALLHLTDQSIPSNHGCYRPVRIIAPPGTIVNVEYPGASVGGNSEIHPHLVMAVYGALRDALPERVSAHDGGTSALCAVGGVHPETGESYANLTNEGCGWGGRSEKDGNSALCVPNGNCALQPVEILETGIQCCTKRWSCTRARLVRESTGEGSATRESFGSTPTRCVCPASSRRSRSAPGVCSAVRRASAPPSSSRGAAGSSRPSVRRSGSPATASSQTSTYSTVTSSGSSPPEVAATAIPAVAGSRRSRRTFARV